MVLIPPKEFEKQCLIKLHKPNNLEINNESDKNSEKNLENTENRENIDNEKIINKDSLEEETLEDNKIKTLENLDNLHENVNKVITKDTNQLEEVDLNISNINNDVISLKDPKEVYKEIYLAAKKKAHDLRKNALNAYLEAQNIKEKYSFQDMDLSSDEEEQEELNNLFKNNL